jgi:Ca-activated chloride channel homolog
VTASSATTSNAKHTRDTIYIEKRDTIYIRELNEDLRSMEGYAVNNMVLLLDVSGSMNRPEKLPLLKESMLRMLAMMRKEDKISIIAFSSKPKVLLKSTSFKEEDEIRKAVSDLSSSGKTDGKSAIKLAYKIADEYYIRGGNNRIILATDGEFGMDEETEKLIQDFSNNDIFLSVFNFGKGMGSSKTLQSLANRGKGNYEAISEKNIDIKLIGEVKAKRNH